MRRLRGRPTALYYAGNGWRKEGLVATGELWRFYKDHRPMETVLVPFSCIKE